MVDALVAATLAGIPTPGDIAAKGKGLKGFGKGWGGWYGKGINKGGKPWPSCPYQALGIDPKDPQDLMATSMGLWDACLNVQDDKSLDVAWAKVKLARQQIQRASGLTVDTGINESLLLEKKKLQPNGKLHERMVAEVTSTESPDQKQERKKAMMQRIIDMLKEAPNFTLEATRLMNDMQVRSLRVGIFDHFIKFATNNFPSYFEIERIPGKTQFNVILKDPTVDEVDMSVEQNVGGKKRRHW